MNTMGHAIAFRIFIVAVPMLLANVSSYSECPNVCTCNWKNGKQTTDCSGKGLAVIPYEINPDTQVLDVSNNSFEEIPRKLFYEKGLANLQKIFLSDCGITQIASDAFYQLSLLAELDLSGNKLQSIPTEALQECPNLLFLKLSRNPIDKINVKAFVSLSRLKSLFLTNCSITHVQPGALDGLDELKLLDLGGNKLTTLSGDVFKSLTKMRFLELSENPWYCDCRIKDVIEWKRRRYMEWTTDPPHCNGPEMRNNASWEVMSLDEFACPPVIVNAPDETDVIVGHNTSILCQVEADPKASIHWEVSGKSLKYLSSLPELGAKYSVVNEDWTRQASILTVNKVQESDSGSYVCVAENKAGISSANFNLRVVLPRHIKYSKSNITIHVQGIEVRIQGPISVQAD